MVHVIGPKWECVQDLKASDGFNVQVALGIDPSETVKLIPTGRAGVLAVKAVHTDAVYENLEATMRVHPGKDGDAANIPWPGEPTSVADLYKARWGLHTHGQFNATYRKIHARWTFTEHGIYTLAYGPLLISECHFDHCGAQGSQVRSYQGERPAGLPASDPSHVQEASDNVYDYCGLWHSWGRAALACTFFDGVERVEVRRNAFTHRHHPGGWLEWQNPKAAAEPGAINVQGRPSVAITGNVIDYVGMGSRPVVRVVDIKGLARISGNVFKGGGCQIVVDNAADVVIAKNTFIGTGPAPIVRVFDGGGAEIHKGPITQDWTN